MSELLLVGLNHRSAPIEVRERFTVPEARLGEAVRSLAECPGVREALLLSTCNRLELLVVREAGGGPHAFLREYFSADAPERHLYEYRGEAAVRHLFRVAASL